MPVIKNKILLLFLVFPFWSCVQIAGDNSKIISVKSDSIQNKEIRKWNSEDEFYSIFFLGTSKVKITDHRPSKTDTTIKLCIPAAFTLLEDGSIDGLFIIEGKILDAKKVNHHLGGGLLLTKDSVDFIKTNEGKTLTSSWIDSVSNFQASFFQQIQLVREGKNLEFHKDQKLFQRRAVVEFITGEIAIIESKSAISLQEFSDDLVQMKVLNAIYTDMGSYDEGWVRNPENRAIRTIGHNRIETAKQSNWLIFSQ